MGVENTKKFMPLLNDESIRKLVYEGIKVLSVKRLTLAHALELTRLPSKELQIKLAKEIEEKKLSITQVKRRVDELLGRRKLVLQSVNHHARCLLRHYQKMGLLRREKNQTGAYVYYF